MIGDVLLTALAASMVLMLAYGLSFDVRRYRRRAERHDARRASHQERLARDLLHERTGNVVAFPTRPPGQRAARKAVQ